MRAEAGATVDDNGDAGVDQEPRAPELHDVGGLAKPRIEGLALPPEGSNLPVARENGQAEEVNNFAG